VVTGMNLNFDNYLLINKHKALNSLFELPLMKNSVKIIIPIYNVFGELEEKSFFAMCESSKKIPNFGST
jgi:hypothetical protein